MWPSCSSLYFSVGIKMKTFFLECPNETALRLADGSQTNEGRVEYCINGVWRILCNDGFRKLEAEVVCRQLGYEEITSM